MRRIARRAAGRPALSRKVPPACARRRSTPSSAAARPRFVPGALFDNGLYCRPDDLGDVVVQVAPPLICGQAELREMEQILRQTLSEAQNLI
jgi:adenosylmethionine-8-amino-7-oxononanoate aminotransferase